MNMQENFSQLIQKASQTWLVAAEKLGIRVTAPFAISMASHSIQCIAFVPDFGSANGTIVGVMHSQTFNTDSKLKEYAKRNGIFYSFVNPLGWIEYDEAAFKDALEDWGYYGPQDKCPVWFKGSKGGQSLPSFFACKVVGSFTPHTQFAVDL